MELPGHPPTSELAIKPATSIPKPENSPKVTWGPVAAVLVTLAAFFGAQIIGGVLVVFIMATIRGQSIQMVADQGSNVLSADYMFYTVLAIESLTVGFIYLFLRNRHASFKTLGLKRFQVADIGRAVGGYGIYFVTFYAISMVIQARAPQWLKQEQDLGFSRATNGPALILVFISLVILPPLVEEILCRGFLYTGLRTKLKPIGAAIITSILFASAHLQWGSAAPLLWVAAIDTFLLSLVLCYLRERTCRLWASIFLHGFKNLIAFAVIFIFKIG